MTPVQRDAAMAGIEVLSTVAAAIPGVQSFSPILFDIARSVVLSGHEDPAQRLREIAASLRREIEDALERKFPEG